MLETSRHNLTIHVFMCNRCQRALNSDSAHNTFKTCKCITLYKDTTSSTPFRSRTRIWFSYVHCHVRNVNVGDVKPQLNDSRFMYKRCQRALTSDSAHSTCKRFKGIALYRDTTSSAPFRSRTRRRRRKTFIHDGISRCNLLILSHAVQVKNTCCRINIFKEFKSKNQFRDTQSSILQASKR